MKQSLFVIGIFWSGLLAAGQATGDDAKSLQDNRHELEQIKSQMTEARRKVDSLRTVEKNLQKAVAKYGDQVSRTRKVVGNLEKQLAGVRGEINANSTSLADAGDRLLRIKETFVDLLVEYYHSLRVAASPDWWDFEQYTTQKRLTYYLAALSGASIREIGETTVSLQRLTQQVDSLKRADAGLSHLRKEKKAKINLDLALKEKEESSLGSVRRQTSMLQDRLSSLSEAARQMEDIIARIEQAQKKKAATKSLPRFGSGSFASLEGRLTMPIDGTIVSSFGWKTDKTTKLKSFSPGVDIRPSKAARTVAACAPGRVAYVGTLRGYATFVILEHDDGYFTTYAGLSRAAVEMDDLVQSGQMVGDRGDGPVHFEIRRGREHLDPVLWLDINGF